MAVHHGMRATLTAHTLLAGGTHTLTRQSHVRTIHAVSNSLLRHNFHRSPSVFPLHHRSTLSMEFVRKQLSKLTPNPPVRRLSDDAATDDNSDVPIGAEFPVPQPLASALHLQPQLPDHPACYVCDHPCEHPQYPAALVRKIELDSMNDVKPYKRHFLVLYGKSYNSWPEKIEKQKDTYIGQLSAVLNGMSDDLPYAVRLNITDEASETLDDEPRTIVVDKELIADIHVYPDMVKLHGVRVDAFKQVLQELVVQGKADSYVQQRMKQYNEATSPDVSKEAASYPSIAGLKATPLAGTHFLVCAHKLRDKRCGVMGKALMEALAQEGEAQSVEQQVTPYAISHVGGHKFAGNVIVQPDGDFYGRMSACQSKHLVEAYVKKDQATRKSLRAWLRGSMDVSW